jgi:hypothetical protein
VIHDGIEPREWSWELTNAQGRAYLDNVRRNKGPFTDEEGFDASIEAISAMEKMRILFVPSSFCVVGLF